MPECSFSAQAAFYIIVCGGTVQVCAFNKSHSKDLGDSPINKNTNSVAALAYIRDQPINRTEFKLM